MICTGLIGVSDYFTMGLTDDSFLVNDDDLVVHRDMVNLANWELNRKKAGIDDKKEELEKDQVRFNTGGLDMI